MVKKKKVKILRDPITGRIKKGAVLNPKGRPLLPEVVLLRKAVKAASMAKKKDFYRHVVERAFVNDAVLIALMKKFVPDLKSYQGIITTFEASMDDELAKTIQQKLYKERYEE